MKNINDRIFSNVILIFMFLVVITACDSGAGKFSDEEYFSYMREGRKALDGKNYSKAIKYYTKAIKNCPRCIHGYEFRSIAYSDRAYVQKKYADNGDFYLAIIDELESHYISMNMKQFYEKYENSYSTYEEDIVTSTKRINLNPRDYEAYKKRGDAYNSIMGESKNVIENYTKAININSKYTEVYTRRGFTYDSIGQFDLAIDDYTKAINLDPSIVENYIYRGFSHEALNNFDKAIVDYKKVLSLDSNIKGGYINLAHAYYRKDEFDLAIQNFTKEINNNIESGIAYNFLGVISIYNKNEKKKGCFDLDSTHKLHKRRMHNPLDTYSGSSKIHILATLNGDCHDAKNLRKLIDNPFNL